MKFQGIQWGVTKIIKRVNDYSYRKILEKFWLAFSIERTKSGDLTETFKIINGISYYGKHIFNISHRTRNLLPRQNLSIN